MSDSWLRRFAWVLAVFAVIVSIVSSIWLFAAADYSRTNWLWVQVQTITGTGALILGLVIILRQPRHRVGWLWLFLGVLSRFISLGNAIYYGSGSQATGYSSLEYFLLWSAEAANLIVLMGQSLLLLWFPDGHLPSRRWRLLYLPLFLSIGFLSLGLFVSGPNWNGGENAGGIVINNPYGWLPEHGVLDFVGFPAFITFVVTMILAAVSLIFRYRSAPQLVRYQIQWFVLGGLLFVIMNFAPVFISEPDILTNNTRLIYIIAYSNNIPLYFAVGLAILRYRLYDIDIIIRRTLQYTLLTGLLVLVYFGSVIFLQNLTENLVGEQSPLVIVLSTLMIAALFNPLRGRVQAFINRRFFRKKYDTEQTLTNFAAIARDEVDMERLTAALLDVVGETMQPEGLSLWLKQEENKRL